MTGAEVAARAAALAGVRFRPQGRDPAHGLDCVGVVLAATGRAGIGALPRRWSDADAAAALLHASGLARAEAGVAGDVVLIDVGARQLHLAVLVAGGHVHACARAGRVVAVPGAPAGQIIGYWRV